MMDGFAFLRVGLGVFLELAKQLSWAVPRNNLRSETPRGLGAREGPIAAAAATATHSQLGNGAAWQRGSLATAHTKKPPNH